MNEVWDTICPDCGGIVHFISTKGIYKCADCGQYYANDLTPIETEEAAK